MTGEASAESARIAEEIADLAQQRGVTIAVAESLTGGLVASGLGAAPNAADWFRGGVVAYAPEVKFDLLGVEPGPVVTAQCAREMAAGVRRLLGADVAVASTGVGGPGKDEGKPAGTVYLACVGPGEEVAEQHLTLDGDPGEVVSQAVDAAMRLVRAALSDGA